MRSVGALNDSNREFAEIRLKVPMQSKMLWITDKEKTSWDSGIKIFCFQGS